MQEKQQPKQASRQVKLNRGVMKVSFIVFPGDMVIDPFGDTGYVTHVAFDTCGDKSCVVRYPNGQEGIWWNEVELLVTPND